MINAEAGGRRGKRVVKGRIICGRDLEDHLLTYRCCRRLAAHGVKNILYYRGAKEAPDRWHGSFNRP